MISDTHGYLDPAVLKYFEECDEIWHAGDIGSAELADELHAFRPLRAVHGNIDDTKISISYPEDQCFECEGIQVWITHIGGYPGRYDKRVVAEFKKAVPELFVCGHSHILKVSRDKKRNEMLVMNPGAAGIYGFHKIRTILRLTIDSGKIKDVEAIELGPRSL